MSVDDMVVVWWTPPRLALRAPVGSERKEADAECSAAASAPQHETRRRRRWRPRSCPTMTHARLWGELANLFLHHVFTWYMIAVLAYQIHSAIDAALWIDPLLLLLHGSFFFCSYIHTNIKEEDPFVDHVARQTDGGDPLVLVSDAQFTWF